jgi:hypothetical protein
MECIINYEMNLNKWTNTLFNSSAWTSKKDFRLEFKSPYEVFNAISTKLMFHLVFLS